MMMVMIKSHLVSPTDLRLAAVQQDPTRPAETGYELDLT